MRRYLVPIALFLIAVPAAANAPPDQYDSFTKTDPEFIHDTKTTLTWDRPLKPDHSAVISPDGSYASIEAVCSLRGYRVPTIKELLTLFDEMPAQIQNQDGIRSLYIDHNAFDGMRVDLPFWSSTDAEVGKVWTLNFGTGDMMPLEKSSTQGYVRCVR